MRLGQLTKIRCGKCKSLRVARTVNDDGHLVCLDCGHEESSYTVTYLDVCTTVYKARRLEEYKDF